MDDFAIYAISAVLICLFGIFVAVRLSSPWGVDLRLSDAQIGAAIKRIADAMEKLSIGSFLYWFFQNQTIGLFIGFLMMALSLAITITGASK